MARLAEMAAAEESQIKERLFRLACRPDSPDLTWQSLQPDAAFKQGQIDRTDFIINLEYEQLSEEEPASE